MANMVFKDEDTVIYNEYIMKNNEYESEVWKRDKTINKLCRKNETSWNEMSYFCSPEKNNVSNFTRNVYIVKDVSDRRECISRAAMSGRNNPLPN